MPKKVNPKKATNIVVMAVAVMTIGYLIVAGIMLLRNTDQLTEKLNAKNALGSGQISAEYFLWTGMDMGDIEAVCFGKKCFDVDLAQTAKERQKGLMNVEHMATTSGMLFVFDSPAVYKFWMKNTMIALDIIWFDDKFEVMYIEKDTPTCKTIDPTQQNCPSYGPKSKSHYVLEINGGLTDMMNIKIGDTINFKLKK